MYLNFSYVRPSGGLLVVWHPVDNPEAKLREELGGLFEKAGIRLEISQTDP
jgi:hypothetical protein